MATLKCLASLVPAATIVPARAAETRCPGNAAVEPSTSATATRSFLSYPSATGPYNFL